VKRKSQKTYSRLFYRQKIEKFCRKHVRGSVKSRQEARDQSRPSLKLRQPIEILIWQSVYSRKTFLEKLEIFSRIRKEHSKANIKDIATKGSCKPKRKAKK
jgi:hypothetical protein